MIQWYIRTLADEIVTIIYHECFCAIAGNYITNIGKDKDK